MRLKELRCSLRAVRDGPNVRSLLRWGKVMADHTRMNILGLLKTYDGLTAAELEAGLGISQVPVSQQMRFLTRRRLVHASREGKWVRYSIDSHIAGRVPSPTVDPVADTPSRVVLSPVLKKRLDRWLEGKGEERARELRRAVLTIQEHEMAGIYRYQTLALADRTRLLMLALIALHPDVTATELAAVLRVTHVAAGKHLTVLRRAGMVTRQRRGKWWAYAASPGIRRTFPVRTRMNDNGA